MLRYCAFMQYLSLNIALRVFQGLHTSLALLQLTQHLQLNAFLMTSASEYKKINKQNQNTIWFNDLFNYNDWKIFYMTDYCFSPEGNNSFYV